MSSILKSNLLILLVLILACGPSDPLEEIRASHQAGKFTEGISDLRRMLDKDPSHAEASLLLGTALLRTGNAGTAVWPLRKASETPEYAVEAGLLLAEAMLASRTAPDALKEIDRVLEIDPNNLQALILRVEANRSEAKHEDSLVDIERVLELQPENLEVLVNRVVALISLKRIDEAGTALDSAQASFDAGKDQVAPLMLAKLCIARALFNFEKGEKEAAEQYFAECAERFPTDQTAVEHLVAYYDRVGQSERATEVLERAAEESKGGAFRTNLARRLGALGDSEAEERILREEAEARESELAWFVLADYYVQRDRFDEAITAFERAIALNSESARLRFAYADTLVQAERFDEAREVAKRLPQSELRSLILGRILLGEGNPRGALKAFEAGIRLWPNNAVGRFLAGQAAERVGDFQRATSHYRESFRTSPGASKAGQALAELYAARGLTGDALQIASRYLKGRPRNPEAYLMSIRIAHSAGRHKVVVEGLERLARLQGQAAIAAAEGASLMAAEGKNEEAVEAVESSGLDLTEPSSAIALRVLIESLGKLGRSDEATALADRALAAHPDEAVFHELKGDALRASAETEAARASYERALELDEQSWRTLAALAALAAESGDPVAALALYDRALAADPSDPAPAFAAVALVREAEPDEAVRRLVKLLDEHPREAPAAIELAGIFADRGELRRARNYAGRATWFKSPNAREMLERIDKLRAAAGEASDPGSPEEPAETDELVEPAE